MNVGIIDSGVGGFSILEILKKNMPSKNYYYIADTGFFPYGDKTIDELIERIDFLIKELIYIKCEQIYFACNTISATIYPLIKEAYDIEILDVITPLIEYINQMCFRNIIVIGSNLLVKSKRYSNELACQNVDEMALPIFIEKLEQNQDVTEEINDLMKVINYKYDCLVLGCTHFIRVQEQFEKFFLGEVISQKSIK